MYKVHTSDAVQIINLHMSLRPMRWGVFKVAKVILKTRFNDRINYNASASDPRRVNGPRIAIATEVIDSI